MTWRHRAACVGESTDLFFPIGTSGPAVLQAEEARRWCAGCPVRAACLQWAFSAGIEHGVWGGLTEEERRAWKRKHLRGRVRADSDLLRDLLVAHEATTAAARPRGSAVPASP